MKKYLDYLKGLVLIFRSNEYYSDVSYLKLNLVSGIFEKFKLRYPKT